MASPLSCGERAQRISPEGALCSRPQLFSILTFSPEMAACSPASLYAPFPPYESEPARLPQCRAFPRTGPEFVHQLPLRAEQERADDGRDRTGAAEVLRGDQCSRTAR